MSKKRIMVIDDDKEFLEELEETLALSGYETRTFSNGNEALSVAPDMKPDLIVLDLKMDEKNGFQLAVEFKNMNEISSVPIIAITGCYTEQEYVQLMNICGIKTCIIKPFNPLDVIAKIERLLS